MRRPVVALRVAETFVSRQGEGRLTGTESFFIRTSGCNLRCRFCDTPYASWNPQGELRTVESLVDEAAASGVAHVVLTGGEPMLPRESIRLSRWLSDRGFHLTIETAGTIDRDLRCDLMSVSPKFASSAPDAATHPGWHRRHEQRRMQIDTLRRLIDRGAQHQLKFVVKSPQDYGELMQIVESLSSDPADVWIMPEGTSVDVIDRVQQWLRPWAESQGFQYCDRMHIRWYGNRRGT